ncbi:MAG: hypothetical protein ABWX94_01395 [Candidatus Saccharimonadales bacterium]
MTDTTQLDSNQSTKNSRRRGRRLNIILSVLLVIAVIAGGFWYWQYHKTADKNPESEQRRWTSELSKVIIMPDEKPLITTVLDKTKLTNETLASQAQNGDRLYIFAKSERLVLYRPADKRVVNMLTIQTKQ